MEQAGSRKSWVRLGHNRISQVLPGFLRGVTEKGTGAKMPAPLWKVTQCRIWVKEGCARERREMETEQDENNSGGM